MNKKQIKWFIILFLVSILFCACGKGASAEDGKESTYYTSNGFLLIAMPLEQPDADYEAGLNALTQARFQEGVDLLNSALDKRKNDAATLDQAKIENALGIAYTILAQYPEAEVAFTEASQTLNTIGKGDTVEAAAVESNHGVLVNKKGEWEKSVQLAENAGAIWEKQLEKSHPYFAVNNFNLARYDLEFENSEAAQSHYKTALKIAKKSLGEQHIVTAMAYLIRGDFQNDKSGIKDMENSLEIQRNLFSEDTPSIAVTHTLIGLYYHLVENNTSKALSHMQEALKIQEKVFNNGHPEIADTYSDLSFLYSDIGDYNQSMIYRQKSIDIHRSYLGENSYEIGFDYIGMASLYFISGDYNLELEYRTKAHKIFYHYGANLSWTISTKDLMEASYNDLTGLNPSGFEEWLQKNLESDEYISPVEEESIS